MISAILLVTVFIWFGLSPSYFAPESNKFAITDLRIEPDLSWTSSNIFLTVTNTYNSPISVVGSRVNGKNFGYSTIEVPPGQTKDITLRLNGLPITNSSSYDASLTFTFDDGKYQVYERTITPKKYGPGFLTHGTERLNASSNNEVFYSVTLENTGNIPMVSAKIVINDSYETPLPFVKRLESKENATFQTIITFPYKDGDVWDLSIEATFADGSIFWSKTRYTFNV